MTKTLVALLLMMGTALPVAAQPAMVADEAAVASHVVIPVPPRGQYKTPFVLPVRDSKAWAQPVFSSYGLLSGAPKLDGSATGLPTGGFLVQERTSGRWYASLAGVLVRLTRGHQTVVAQSVQGADVDVHEASGWAVSSEPNGTIRLNPLSGNTQAARTLAKGDFFFAPRFSPDGTKVLFSKSGEKRPQFWIADLTTGKAYEAGEGSWPCWDATGESILFAKTANDGARFTASDLYLYDVRSGRVQALKATDVVAETQLALSPDGRFLAYIDAFTGAIHVVDFARLVKEGR